MRRAILASLILAGCSSGPAEASRIDRQLSELYRPLLALVEESRQSYLDFKKREGRQELLPTDRPLTDEELKRYIDQIEKEMMPRNEKMCAIIRSKRDLAEGPEPASWQALLDHQDGWREDHEKWRKDGVAYPFHARTSFPRSLERELRASIADLEGRRDRAK
jgi:hypothetical protein